MTRTEKAVRRAVQKATVVKKPKAFCTRTTVECIVWEYADFRERRLLAFCRERKGLQRSSKVKRPPHPFGA